MMLDLDILLLGLVGAAFLVTGGALLRGPAVARARFREVLAVRLREEAEASFARAAEAVRVAEGETERIRAELFRLQNRVAEQMRSNENTEQLRLQLDQQAAELKATLAQLNVERELARQLEIQHDQTRAQLRITIEQHKVAEERAAGLEARLQDAERKLKTSEEKLRATETRLKAAETHTRDLETRLRDAESKLKNTEEKLREAEKKLREAPAPPPPPGPDTSALEAAQHKISALERMLEGSRARARELQKELSALKSR
ncbi:MAG: hypothetical protein RMJ98_15660 [Myxococcales bacterium]|nr:hypothetical protein [Polyangiaceae bacterium]MDW8250732.1 hypothetical protein [Myxococcales bacterium]